MSSKQFIKHGFREFHTTGSIVPSSPYLVRRLTRLVNPALKLNIVEFGAGEGCVTRGILGKMHLDSKLTTFELNVDFAKGLKISMHGQRRVRVINDNVLNAHKYIKENSADLVISSLPLGNMKKRLVYDILNEASYLLNEKGVFVQYQYFGKNYFDVKGIFKNLKLGWEPRNIPPAFIYECRK